MIASLGTSSDGEAVSIDLEALIGAHLCIAANSGGGKSGAIRKLLEVTYGHVQQIVLDSEDEFYTLRERFDYVIAGGDGDAPATVANARGLARASVANDFSLIAQINDLDDDAGTFIVEFLDELLALPRDQWRPLLVVIDEAQRFAPSGSSSDSAIAIKSLMQRGRKRGFTAVVATTRISELHAGVRGQAKNWLIGLVGQSLDRRTAADQLGFGANSAEGRGLQLLEPRQFWAFGPALSRLPKMLTVGAATTTIVKHGQVRVPTPPAPEALREILAALTIAPAKVSEAGASDTVAASEELVAGRRRIADLKDERQDLLAELSLLRGVDAECGRYSDGLAAIGAAIDALLNGRPIGMLQSGDANLHSGDAGSGVAPDQGSAAARDLPPVDVAEAAPPADDNAGERIAGGAADRKLRPGLQGLIDWLAWSRIVFGDRPLKREILSLLVGRHVRSKGFINDLGELRSAGLIDYPEGGGIELTVAGGMQAMSHAVPTTLAGLRHTVAQVLQPAQRRLFDLVVSTYPAPIGRVELAQAVGHHVRTKSFINNLGRLHSLGLVTYPAAGGVCAADFLMRRG